MLRRPKMVTVIGLWGGILFCMTNLPRMYGVIGGITSESVTLRPPHFMIPPFRV